MKTIFFCLPLSICLQCRKFVFIDINNFEINRDIADLKHFSLSGKKLILRDRKFKQAINLWFIDLSVAAPSLRLERPLAALMATYFNPQPLLKPVKAGTSSEGPQWLFTIPDMSKIENSKHVNNEKSIQ